MTRRRQNDFYASLTDASNSYKNSKKQKQKNENLKKLLKTNLKNQNTKRENSNCKNVKSVKKLKRNIYSKLYKIKYLHFLQNLHFDLRNKYLKNPFYPNLLLSPPSSHSPSPLAWAETRILKSISRPF